MRYIALAYQIQGETRQVNYISVPQETSDTKILTLLLNGFLFDSFKGKLSPKSMKGYGHIDENNIAYGFKKTENELLSESNNDLAYNKSFDCRVSTQDCIIDITPLSDSNEFLHHERLYEDGFSIVRKAIAKQHEIAEKLGFVRIAQESDVLIRFHAQSCIEILPASWKSITYDSLNPNTRMTTLVGEEENVHLRLINSETFVAIAEGEQETSCLVVNYTLKDGQSIDIGLSRSFLQAYDIPSDISIFDFFDFSILSDFGEVFNPSKKELSDRLIARITKEQFDEPTLNIPNATILEKDATELNHNYVTLTWRDGQLHIYDPYEGREYKMTENKNTSHILIVSHYKNGRILPIIISPPQTFKSVPELVIEVR